MKRSRVRKRVIDRSPELLYDNGHDKAILSILQAVKKGDFSVRLPAEWTGMAGKIADEINGLIELNALFAEEFKRVSHAVGKKGNYPSGPRCRKRRGEWKTNIEAVNGLIDDLVRPTTDMARVIGAVAKGDLTQSVALEAEGHPLTRRISEHGQNRQQHGRSARCLCRRSHAGRARSRARKANWAGRRSCRASPARGRISLTM